MRADQDAMINAARFCLLSHKYTVTRAAKPFEAARYVYTRSPPFCPPRTRSPRHRHGAAAAQAAAPACVRSGGARGGDWRTKCARASAQRDTTRH